MAQLTDQLTPNQTRPVSLKLVVVSGPDAGAEFPLNRGTYRLGKDADNEIVLTDTAISRNHLALEVLAHAVKLKDLESRNGSFCNGMRFRELEAVAGMLIKVGRTELRLLGQNERMSLLPSQRKSFGELLGESVRMRELFSVLERVAPTDSGVLLLGETGTGKGLCARMLHEHGPRAKGPFVVCDLGAISTELLQSELFGHVRGAFTGAVSDRAGVFEQAHRGTLLLDGIDQLALESQPKLLGVLERREVRKVGSSNPVAVDVRVLAATHEDLSAAVKEGRFRSDLLHRLAVVELRLPPLRERREDVSPLVDLFLTQLNKEPSFLGPETRALLADYPWHGNVRELKNVVERAVSLGHLESKGARTAPSQPLGLKFKQAKERLLSAFERDYIAHLLEACDWNVRRAAREADIDRVHLYRLMKKYNISEPK